MRIPGEADENPRAPLSTEAANGETWRLICDPLSGEYRVTDGQGRRSLPLPAIVVREIRENPAWMLLVGLDEPETPAK